MPTLSTFKASCLLLLAMTTAINANPVAIKASDEPKPNQLVRLSIGLEPESHELFERTLYDISDPTHPRYGQHLSRDEAKALLRPRRDSTDAVKRWLSQAGVPDSEVSDQGQFIHAHVAVQHAEALLGSRLNSFARREGNAVQTATYSLPAEVQSHIVTIRSAPLQGESALHEATVPRRGLAEGQKAQHGRRCGKDDDDEVDLEKCKTEITPACLRKLYRMGDYYAKPHGKTLFGIAGFNNQSAQYYELERFLETYAPYAAGANFSVELINNGTNPQGEYPSGEANLDIQYAVAMAYDVPVRYYSTGGEYHDFITDLDIPDKNEESVEPYLEFASHLLDLNDDELPQVLSVSYGINEQVIPKPYAKQVCDIFGQLATRGVSVVVASGDLGAGYSCQSNDGEKRTKFMPQFPATCPYVTSVGSTESNSPEMASNFSSGGFSDYFSRPGWQQDAIGDYLRENGDEWKGYYNPDGRAFPDVAAQGRHYRIVNHDQLEWTDGTSASAPVFAAMIALLNEDRAKSNKPPMGFLNPWIYRIGNRGFTDITEAKSVGCPGQSRVGLEAPEIPGAGWAAVSGWDPVTGWGTPLFDRLKSLSSD